MRYKKRKDGRYYANISTGKYDPETGRLIRVSVYGRTQRELSEKIAEINAQVVTNTMVKDKDWTVGAYAAHWVSVTKDGVVQESTMMRYNSLLRNHLTAIKDIRLVDLTRTDIQLCMNQLSGHWATQKELRNMIRSMLETAIDDGLLYRNVCRNIVIDKKLKSDTRALTEAEKLAIQSCDFTIEEKCFVYLLWYTGMRPEEVRSLTKKDIDLKKETISVNNALTFGKNQSMLKEPKTDAGYRTIDILPPLKPVIQSYLDSIDTLYLFTQASGELHTKTTYRRFWQKIYDKINTQMGGKKKITKRSNGQAEIIQPEIKATDITPYVFRHEYATILYYSGIDMKEAARLMGHSDTSMILNVYAELDKNKSSSKEKLSQYLSNAY